jgi:hypothetical protein
MDTVTIYADSKNRDSNLYPYGNTYVLHLTNPITDVVQVDLVSLKVPNTQYNLVDGTAALTFNSTVMNLTPGYYTAAALVDEINARLATQFSNVRWESFDGRFLFQNNGPFTITVSNSISKLLGLEPGVYTGVPASSNPAYAQSLASSAYYIKSSKIVDLTVDEYLFLDIIELRTPSTGEALAINPNGSGTFSGRNARNSFAMIPMSINSGTVKSFSEGGDYPVKVEYPHPINKVSRLTINWIDGNGNSVNFNGFNNNSFVLRFHKAKKEEPPPPPAVDMVELRRIMEDMITIQKPKEPEVKRPLVGRWTLVIFLIVFAIGYYAWSKARAVVPVVAPPVQRAVTA